MPPTPPLELIQQLVEEAERVSDPSTKARLLEAAETIKYFLMLLEMSADYIHDNNEYGADPRFLKAIQEILPKGKA